MPRLDRTQMQGYRARVPLPAGPSFSLDPLAHGPGRRRPSRSHLRRFSSAHQPSGHVFAAAVAVVAATSVSPPPRLAPFSLSVHPLHHFSRAALDASMLEGAFRPPSSATPADATSQPSSIRPGPPYHSIPSCNSQSVRSPGTPPDHSPSATSTTYVAPWPAYPSSHRPYDPVHNHSPTLPNTAPPPRPVALMREQNLHQDKDGKAKKKPAGSACNSCHRLKTRCSGGSPCERCASHNVACEFDRSLIYRSPLASSSQQATAKNASQSNAQPHDAIDRPLAPPLSKSKKRPRSATSTNTQSAAPAPSPPLQANGQTPQTRQMVNGQASPKPAKDQASPHAYVGHPPYSESTDDRLASLEQSVSSILAALGLANHHPTNASPSLKEEDGWFARKRSKPTPALSALPSLRGNGLTVVPERDDVEDFVKGGQASEDDPVVAGLITEEDAVFLFSLFVDNCLPYLPVIHAVSYPAIRSRSQLLFTSMIAIAASFSSSQAAAIPKTSSGGTVDRLANLAYHKLALTLIASTHSVDDMCAALFLAHWRLRSDGHGPSKAVLLGHAARMVSASGFDQRGRLHGDKGSRVWRSGLDQCKVAVCTHVCDIMTGAKGDTSMPNLPLDGVTLVDLARGSPHQYDVASSAVIQALQELADLRHNSKAFVASASGASTRDAVTREESNVLAAALRYNEDLDTWGSRWIYSGSVWAPLLGSQLRTLRLLADDYRITLNLAVCHSLLLGNPSPKGSALQDGLNTALDRVNMASTTVIQSHKDALREGASLAFCPDVVTDGLVTAAMTMIQLASKSMDGPMTPTSHDSGMMNTPAAAHPPSPTSPVSLLLRPFPLAQQLMDHAVASHFIKMATEVLSIGERSEITRGSYVTMIYRFATQIGLREFEHLNHASNSGPPTNTIQNTSTNVHHDVTGNNTMQSRSGQGSVASYRRSRSISSSIMPSNAGGVESSRRDESRSPAGSV